MTVWKNVFLMLCFVGVRRGIHIYIYIYIDNVVTANLTELVRTSRDRRRHIDGRYARRTFVVVGRGRVPKVFGFLRARTGGTRSIRDQPAGYGSLRLKRPPARGVSPALLSAN